MVFVFTFLLIASLEIASGNDEVEPPIETEVPEEPDICVGCDDKEEVPPETEQPQLTVEIVIDPLTGNVQYIIKGLEIE